MQAVPGFEPLQWLFLQYVKKYPISSLIQRSFLVYNVRCKLKLEGKVLQNLRRQCFLSVFLLCSRKVNIPRISTFLGSQLSHLFLGSQLFLSESTFPEEVKLSQGSKLFRGSQLFPRETTFPEGVNFSRGSQLFQGSQIFLRESTFPEEVICPSLSHK